MINTSTNRPIEVSTDEVAGAWIRLPESQVERVRQLLGAHDIPHWLDHLMISVNGCPAQTVIHLRWKADPRRAQEVLDGAV